MELDKKDLTILNELVENARLSYREIAKKTGLSAVTVMNRIKRLEKEGIIQKYSMLIDYEKLNYELQALIAIRVSKGKLFQVEKKIATHPNVCAVYDITGPFDVVVLVRFKNRRGLDNFVKKVQTYDFVERTETNLILNTIKEEQVKF